jgi:hypothetical protein
MLLVSVRIGLLLVNDEHSDHGRSFVGDEGERIASSP